MIHPLARVHRSQAGFTLAETLLASVLGAMLLSSLALTTFGFTHTLDFMEVAAGVNDDADPVLRRITKEVREAYYVTMPDSKTLDVFDDTGVKTEYAVHDNSSLWVTRPNGDTGEIYGPFIDFTLDPTFVERKREGTPTHHDGIFYQASASGSALTLVASGSSESIAVAFVAPELPKDVPGQADVEEQITDVAMSVVDLPIAFVSGSGTKKVDFAVYEGWAPGKARPYGSALVSGWVNGSSLPAAVSNGAGGWQVPSSTSALSLAATLTPGVGYTLVITPEGSTNKAVVTVVPVVPSVDIDEVSKLSGSAWTPQPYVIPFDIKGPWTMTSTTTTQVISMVTLTAYPTNRPLQQRSAAVLTQCLTDDPWLGVVPGEVAP
jgi:hypothetical protein